MDYEDYEKECKRIREENKELILVLRLGSPVKVYRQRQLINILQM